MKKDARRAVRWYEHALELGHEPSYYELHMMLWDGFGVRKDSKQAFELSLRSAETRNRQQLPLRRPTTMHTAPVCVAIVKKAIHWYRKAAAAGDDDAMVSARLSLLSTAKACRRTRVQQSLGTAAVRGRTIPTRSTISGSAT